MQAILRSRIPRNKRGTGAPTRIEVSAPLRATEKDCTANGEFDKGLAAGLALDEFRALFGAALIDLATGPRAVWTMEVI